jgi:hypothetical protein
MSNRAILTSMKFEALSGDVCYGYTLSDQYALDFDNNAEAMIEDDLDLLRYAIKNAGNGGDEILDSVIENEKGILINDNWYDWDEIKDIMQGDES